MVDAHFVFLMRSVNYKVIVSIGRSVDSLKRREVLVDTGAGPNCIREDALPRKGVVEINQIRLHQRPANIRRKWTSIGY